MRGSRVVGLDPVVSFSAELQRPQHAGSSVVVGCSECSTEASTGLFSALDDVCVRASAVPYDAMAALMVCTRLSALTVLYQAVRRNGMESRARNGW